MPLSVLPATKIRIQWALKMDEMKKTSKHRIHILETQEIALRVDGGVDHSASGVVLLKYNGLRLVWRKPGSCWSGNYQPHRYIPATLEVAPPRDGGKVGHWSISKEIFEGGRLSKAKIKQFWPRIKEFMKLPDEVTADMIDKAKTVVVDSDDKKSDGDGERTA